MTTRLAHTNSVLWLEDHSQLTHAQRIRTGRSDTGNIINASWVFDNPRLIGTRRSIMAGKAEIPHSRANVASWAVRHLVYLLFLLGIYFNQERIFLGLVMPLTRTAFHHTREILIRRLLPSDTLPFEVHEIKM